MAVLEGLHLAGWPLLAGLVSMAAMRSRGARTPAVEAGRRVVDSPWFGCACLWALHPCLAAVLVFAAVEMARPGYSEWVEWGVCHIARLWVAGRNVYPRPADLALYRVYPYGPLLFQALGATYLASGGVLAAPKVLAAVLAAGTAAVLFATFRRGGAPVRAALTLTEALMVLFGIMGFMAKADIMLIALASLACWVVACGRRDGLVVLGLAVLAGVAGAIKLHGALYVAPAIIAQVGWRRCATVQIYAACAVVACGVSLLPFLMPRTSLGGYVFVLRMAAGDGLLLGIFISNICFLGMFLWSAQVLAGGAAGVPRRSWLLLSGVGLCGLAVSVFAAKAEAGPHHLLPFLPYLGLVVAPALSAADDASIRLRRLVLALVIVSFQPVTSVSHYVPAIVQHWRDGGTLI